MVRCQLLSPTQYDLAILRHCYRPLDRPPLYRLTSISLVSMALSLFVREVASVCFPARLENRGTTSSFILRREELTSEGSGKLTEQLALILHSSSSNVVFYSLMGHALSQLHPSTIYVSIRKASVTSGSIPRMLRSEVLVFSPANEWLSPQNCALCLLYSFPSFWSTN